MIVCMSECGQVHLISPPNFRGTNRVSFSWESLLQRGLGHLTHTASSWSTSCTWPRPAQRRTGHFVGLDFSSDRGAIYSPEEDVPASREARGLSNCPFAFVFPYPLYLPRVGPARRSQPLSARLRPFWTAGDQQWSSGGLSVVTVVPVHEGALWLSTELLPVGIVRSAARDSLSGSAEARGCTAAAAWTPASFFPDVFPRMAYRSQQLHQAADRKQEASGEEVCYGADRVQVGKSVQNPVPCPLASAAPSALRDHFSLKPKVEITF